MIVSPELEDAMRYLKEIKEDVYKLADAMGTGRAEFPQASPLEIVEFYLTGGTPGADEYTASIFYNAVIVTNNLLKDIDATNDEANGQARNINITS